MNVPGGISISEQLCYLQNEGKNFDIAQCLIEYRLQSSLEDLLWIIPLIIVVILILPKRKE